MKILFEKGIVNKIKNGIKIMGKGADKIKSFGVPINIEASNATQSAIDCITETGGKISVQYRTPYILRNYLKPHKFPEYKTLKIPMPAPKKLAKLEKLKDKGLEVSYPPAPWYTENEEKIKKNKLEREKRMANGQFAELLPQFPVVRYPGMGVDKPRM